MQVTKMIKPGTMLPDTPNPTISLTDSPANVSGSTHLFPMICDSFKHIALFVIADHRLPDPHPLFQTFSSICSPYKASLRPVILARSNRIGGLRRPNWASDDILFLATHKSSETAFGLNGKDQMGIMIVRPDGYVATSITIDANGNNFKSLDTWLTSNLVKS
jgi:hypothetical protein